MRSPNRREAEKTELICTKPPNLYFANDAKPAEAMQPHSEQTGRPPNWQGVIGVVKSEETHAVVWANMHSWGDEGGS